MSLSPIAEKGRRGRRRRRRPSSSSACTSAAAVFDTQGRTEDAKKSTQPLPFIPEIKKKGHKIKIKANNL
jgi:hypothetical protein